MFERIDENTFEYRLRTETINEPGLKERFKRRYIKCKEEPGKPPSIDKTIDPFKSWVSFLLFDFFFNSSTIKYILFLVGLVGRKTRSSCALCQRTKSIQNMY